MSILLRRKFAPWLTSLALIVGFSLDSVRPAISAPLDPPEKYYVPLPGERPNTTIYVDSRDGKVVFMTGGIGAPFEEGLAIVRRGSPFGVDGDRRVGYSELQIERELGPADESRDTPLAAAPKIRFEVGDCPICHGNPLKERLPVSRHHETVRVLQFTEGSRGRFRHMVWLVPDRDGIWRVFHDETWDEEFRF